MLAVIVIIAAFDDRYFAANDRVVDADGVGADFAGQVAAVPRAVNGQDTRSVISDDEARLPGGGSAGHDERSADQAA